MELGVEIGKLLVAFLVLINPFMKPNEINI